MLMNRMETVLVNSPPRRWLQRYEARVLTALGGRTPGARVAELGCGSGYGTRLILDEFGAARVDAVDLDPAMISRARHRLRRHTGRAHLARGSATDLRSAFHDVGGGQNGTYDAVFDFAIIHHIPNWREALDEVARVLKPGGRFFFDEVTATALARPTYQVLFDHPSEDRFTAGEFLHELSRHGLDVGERWRTRIGGDYLLGVATRQ
ncbi:class I SAM-dependent methyltransferase [Gordonia terrae]|jgi:ubiquinone/menaquinone biosynthesis C-methylase UbiE|uniref:Class I SAM-dependent methyltransferase n=4 Tax=Gordoniaceae TaxID=85026 RepID=A0A2I1R4N3_9ACTN|nr:class I SAM-dependent methyltransferase [Gordonia sp. 135]ETA06213.1 SAM-dependent methyltransferase [Gordonia alkanivorans CGMCC 6845]KSU55647.1 SAM-dependent methyltransferase [Gordonia sp. SGD-V-85]MAU83041.1 class I SAM-dependent methyltransferase [Gordonia sp. (in: high G+C Gram-positive bacteria)]OUC76178.1 SAM-dependent methyltransferase [Gordonia lacunae]PKZ64086.1 class I SAM-dependent methyltransferase [Gordonia terrae]SCC51464.1 Methyltransferase domain-containing protein [Gordo